MKVLVISDTHGNTRRVDQLVELYKEQGGIECMIHCGDYISDAREIHEKYPYIPMYMVAGNCDGVAGGNVSELIEIEGVPILITHGHKHHVKYNYDDIYIDGKAHEAKLVCFGHSHSACKEKKEGLWIMNPGSLSEPRDTMYPSFAILEIEKGQIKDISLLQMTGFKKITRHPYF